MPPACPRSPDLRQEWLRSVIVGAAVLIVGWLVFYPLGIIFEMGLRAEDGSFTLAHYYRVFTEPGLVSALVNSIIISVATTGFALALALPMAWAVARTDMPGRQFVRVSVLVAFVIPNFISVIAWILLLGPNAGLINVFLRETFGIARLFNIYSMEGLVLVLTLSFYPLIFFAVTAALDNMDPSYEEAAQMVGAPAWRASMGIALPLVSAGDRGVVGVRVPGSHGRVRRAGRDRAWRALPYADHQDLRAVLLSAALRARRGGGGADHRLHHPRPDPAALGARRPALQCHRRQVDGRARGRYRLAALAALRATAWLVIFASVILPLIILLRTSLLSRWGLPISWQNLTLKNYAAFADTRPSFRPR